MSKIMIVEDDDAIRDELALLLTNEGYQVSTVTDFSTVVPVALQSKVDLILLDINLPGRDGFSLCSELRQRTTIPIMIVTSRNSGLDEIRALSLGGDDYITKPYNIPVLLARVKALLRRSGRLNESDTLCACGLTLQLSKGIVLYAGQNAELTRNELKILAHLMTHAGQIISRADLMEVLWSEQIYIDDNTLSVNMTRLRNKLEVIGFTDGIKTRRGMGYQLCD